MENRFFNRNEIERDIDNTQNDLIKIYTLGMSYPEMVDRDQLNKLERRLSRLQDSYEAMRERMFINEVTNKYKTV